MTGTGPEDRIEAERAYTEYVSARLPTLRRIAHLLCKDFHRADDVVQTTLTKLYVHWRRARAADDLDRYVHTMLVRCFLNEQRLEWARVRLSGPHTKPPGCRRPLACRTSRRAPSSTRRSCASRPGSAPCSCCATCAICRWRRWLGSWAVRRET